MARETPYGAFNFLVEISGSSRDAGTALGGFSDVSGLTNEMTVAEYRNGNDLQNHVKKIPGPHKIGDTTLKRGLVNSSDFWEWVEAVRTIGINAQRSVTITLLDEARAPVQKWTLQGVIPLKYTGPTLAAKGGGDAAMEELVLSSESMDFEYIGG
jgi:phage tail-like protein